ncbi:MAG: ribulokinase, partial [Planctomycetes bacterium]|nr:ribulokinase [Planctomycetota bacterium]
MSAYAIGLDFGTNSVRAIVVDTADGTERGSAVFDYPHGDMGVVTDAKDPNTARQHPADYIAGIEYTVTEALKQAGEDAAANVVGIGVDATGSTPMPVDAEGVALALKKEFAENRDAMAWLWKDHTSVAEAEEITALAAKRRPHFLAKCGGTYSSEWFFSK